MKKRIGIILISILLIVSSLVIVYPIKALIVSSDTLYVGGTGPGNYTRIQDAINASSNGDTIFVYNGIYYENIVIDKPLSLKGKDKNLCVIDSREEGEIILTINSSQVTLDSFTIINGSCMPFSLTSDGIRANSVDNLKISNVIFTDCYKAIRLIDSTNVIIENCKFYNNNEDSIVGDISEDLVIRNCFINNTGLIKQGGWYRPGGITITCAENGVLNFKIYNCTIRNIVGWGISIKGEYGNSEVFSNNIDNASNYGIYIYGESYFDIHNNLIKGCEANEIDVRLSPKVSNNKIIQNNIILNEFDELLAGISILSSNSVRVINNSIQTNKKYGIMIRNSSYNILEGNTIDGFHEYGIELYPNCTDNIIKNNNINHSHFYNIGISNCCNNNILGNNLTKADYLAIYITSSNDNNIEMNNIYNNQNGLIITNSRHNIIKNNNFIYNNQNAYIQHSLQMHTFLFANDKFKGNYWDDYSGYGPKKINASLTILFPLLDRTVFLDYFKYDWYPAKEPYNI